MIFTFIDAEQPENDKVLEFFDVSDDSDLPAYMIFNMEKNARYRSDNNADMDADKITDFVSKHLEGTLKRNLKSQDVPKDWDKKPVKVG